MSPDARRLIEDLARQRIDAAVEKEKRAVEHDKAAADLRKSAEADRALAADLGALR